jgi:tetratricopeptide (TPR) repeat protein
LSFEPETLLGKEDAFAYRRFLDWGVGAGFDLAIVQIETPWKRDALIEWTRAQVPGTQTVALTEVGPGKRRLWDMLGEACAPGKGTQVLVLHGLEEAEAQARIIAQLNVERDELVKGFPLPWVLIVHPVASRMLQDNAPDFVDFAGLWLYEEAPEGLQGKLSTIDSPKMVAAPAPMGEVGEGKELLRKAARQIDFGYLDEAEDLLAQFDMRNPKAREEDPDRMSLDGRMLEAQGRLAEARMRYEAALKGYEVQGDRASRAMALHQLASIEHRQSRYEEARRLLQESIASKEEIGDRAGRAASLHLLAGVEESQGRYEEARKLLRESIAIDEEIGNRVGRAASLHVLATIELRHGRYEEARQLLREAIAVFDELGDRAGRASSLHELAVIADSQGRHEEARQLIRESIAIKEEIGDRAGRAASLHELALIELRGGRYEESRRLLRGAIVVKEEIGDRAGLAASLINLGVVDVRLGQFEEGRRQVQRGVDILAEIGSGQLGQAHTVLQAIDALMHPPAASKV